MTRTEERGREGLGYEQIRIRETKMRIPLYGRKEERVPSSSLFRRSIYLSGLQLGGWSCVCVGYIKKKIIKSKRGHNGFLSPSHIQRVGVILQGKFFLLNRALVVRGVFVLLLLFGVGSSVVVM